MMRKIVNHHDAVHLAFHIHATPHAAKGFERLLQGLASDPAPRAMTSAASAFKTLWWPMAASRNSR